MGLCNNPKVKRRLITKVEIADGSLDESIKTVDDKTPLDSLLKNIEGDFRKGIIDEDAISPQLDNCRIKPLNDKEQGEDNREAVHDKIRQDRRLMEILQMIESGIKVSNLPEKDRHYYQRFKEKQQKIFKKS